MIPGIINREICWEIRRYLRNEISVFVIEKEGSLRNSRSGLKIYIPPAKKAMKIRLPATRINKRAANS